MSKVTLRVHSLILAALLGCAGSPASPPDDPPSAPPPQKELSEADRFERDGLAACEEGTRIINAAFREAEGKELSRAEEHRFRKDLERGLEKIREGMNLLDLAYQRRRRPYHLRPFVEATRRARKKVLELRVED